MVAAICIEVSNQRGAGHLFRAIVLAEELLRCGVRPFFVVNECAQAVEKLTMEGFACQVAPLGFDVSWMKQIVSDQCVDIWINDRLHTTAEHGSAIKSLGIRLVTFDDRGDGSEFADLNICALADTNMGRPSGLKVLVGEQWLVLSPALERYRRQRTANGKLLVTLGGSDTYGVTLHVVRRLKAAGRSATVVTGPLFSRQDELASVLSSSTIEWMPNVPDMGELFYMHDLAITGGGITPFEAAATGLPLIIVANEPHEITAAQRLEALGCAFFAGYHENIDDSILLSVPENIFDMSSIGIKCIPLDGAQRVCREILNG